MKKPAFVISLALIGLTGFWSCNNELDVNDNWKEIPVLYGLLDPLDSVHIIKVTKAFLGDGNALYMAQIPDSSYYGDEMIITLVDIAPDGSHIGWKAFDTMWVHNKQPGEFFGGDQKLYRVAYDLKMDHNYMVTLNNTKTGHFSSAVTSLVNPISITKPRGGQKYFSFVSTAETQAEFSASTNGRVYQLVIRLHYKEVDLITHDTTSKFIDWVFPNKKASTLTGNEKITYSFPGSGFYANISAKVKKDEDVKRVPGKVDFIAYAGGDDLSTYIDITSPINSIVLERPEYSNVTNNGIGILSSRTSAVRSCEMTPASIDSLVNGSRTYELGFVFPTP